jgi:hypothetical protein
VVASQIANLTLDLSLGHILCFRCPNESCEPILDMSSDICVYGGANGGNNRKYGLGVAKMARY